MKIDFISKEIQHEEAENGVAGRGKVEFNRRGVFFVARRPTSVSRRGRHYRGDEARRARRPARRSKANFRRSSLESQEISGGDFNRRLCPFITQIYVAYQAP